jgi:hypothetical protein
MYSACRNSSLTGLAHDADEGDGLFLNDAFSPSGMIVTQLAASIAATRPCSNGVTAMKTKFASAFGLAMLSVAFSFSTSFACPETSQTTASAVESTVSESGMNVRALPEVSAPEGQVGEVGAPASVAGNIEAPSTEPSGPSIANAIPVEITVDRCSSH